MTDPNGNHISLREYVDTLFTEKEKALREARAVMDNRLDSMNEIREQLNTQYQEFNRRIESCLSKESYDSKHEMLVQRIESIERSNLTSEGKKRGISTIWQVVLGTIGFIASLALIFNAIRLFSEHL